MNATNLWEKSYPPSLRNYHLDDSTVPESVDEITAQAHAQSGANTAFTLVLPTGLSVGLTYSQVDACSNDFAAYLMNVLGLRPGEVVAIQLPTSLHYPVAAFGAWKAGTIVTNINPLYTARELRAQLEDSGAKVLVVSSMSLGIASTVAQECGVRVIVAGLWEFFPPPVAQALRAKLSQDMGDSATDLDGHASFEGVLAEGRLQGAVPRRRHPVALYQYTGGTTGRSKGAVLTHRNIGSVLTMTDDFTSAYGGAFLASDTVLTVLPLYHVFAFVINFLMFFRKGSHNVLVPNPRPLANLRPAFEQFNITWMTGVDTLYAGLMAEPWFRENPPKLRYAISGGTALRASTGERWRQLVCPILEGYGMTETSCIAAFNPPGANYRVGSVGLPMPGSEMRVIDGDGKDLPPGERGELLVRGPHITSGYLNRPDENEQAIADGWLRTGDIVVMDPDGSITIVDRLKDMILVSGFNVYPNEVEDIIAAHPDVAEVAVIGIPDETTGEAVCACIVPRRGELMAQEVVAHCRTQLTGYKVPKHVRFISQMPKSAVGKILRAQLRQAS